MPLINWKIELKLKWKKQCIKQCILVIGSNHKDGANSKNVFTIRDTNV